MTIANVWILLCDRDRARLLETHGRVHVWRRVREFRRGALDADEWIRTLAGVFAQGLLWKRFDRIVLVAPSGMLDRLHATLTDEVADRVIATVESNLVEVPMSDLPDLLQTEVRPRRIELEKPLRA